SSNTTPPGGGGGGGGGGVLPPPVFTNSRRFGEPLPGLLITPVVALLIICDLTWAGVRLGFWARMSAAAPAACGDAIEVPLMVLVALLLVCHAEVIEVPGAKMSTQVPKLENDD